MSSLEDELMVAMKDKKFSICRFLYSLMSDWVLVLSCLKTVLVYCQTKEGSANQKLRILID